jgi:hypothetical protein
MRCDRGDRCAVVFGREGKQRKRRKEEAVSEGREDRRERERERERGL